VAFKLDLPSSTSIHPVFHVSRLKKHVGNRKVQDDLPVMPKEPLLLPQAVLDRRIVKRFNQAAAHVLVLWKGLSRAEAAWELAENLALRFPQFSLEDRGIVASH
jgi:hypothetical protein